MMLFSSPHIMSRDHRTPAAQSGYRTTAEDAALDPPDEHSASADDVTCPEGTSQLSHYPS